jgi:colicin import membrane protein
MRFIITTFALVMLAACTTNAPPSSISTPSSNRASEPYGPKVVRAIKSNIVVQAPIDGNPEALVTIVTAADGLITSIAITRSSGNAEWDKAVTRALERTERLPLDENGKAPPVLQISFRPK